MSPAKQIALGSVVFMAVNAGLVWAFMKVNYASPETAIASRCSLMAIDRQLELGMPLVEARRILEGYPDLALRDGKDGGLVALTPYEADGTNWWLGLSTDAHDNIEAIRVRTNQLDARPQGAPVDRGLTEGESQAQVKDPFYPLDCSAR